MVAIKRNGIPKDEISWVSYMDNSGNELFVITSKKQRDSYILYKNEDGVYKKLGKSENPKELEEKHRVFEIMHEN